MSTFTIRSHDDAWRPFDLLRSGEGRNITMKFKDCIISVDASAPIDGMSSATFFINLQQAVRRELCWLKYGKRHLGKLTWRDRVDTTIVSTHYPDGRHVRYDLTRALNALVAVVEQWDEHGPISVDRTMNLFAAPEPEKPKAGESWARTAREVVPAMKPTCAKRIWR